MSYACVVKIVIATMPNTGTRGALTLSYLFCLSRLTGVRLEILTFRRIAVSNFRISSQTPPVWPFGRRRLLM